MKKFIGWLHLWLGLASGLVVLIVALTGSLLVFEDELQHLFQPSLYYVKMPAPAKKISVDLLAAQVQERYPAYKPNSIIIEPEADRTIIFNLKKSEQKGDLLMVVVNPYTRQIIKTADVKSRFFTVILQLHRYLCMGETGKVITGISCSMFVILIITGLVLWWPKKNNRKQRFRIKWNASFKRLNWDLHAISGFYANIVILLIALTGLVWSYKWVNDLIFYTFDGTTKMHKLQSPKSTAVHNGNTAYLDRILERTNEKLPYYGPVTIRFAENDSLAVSVAKLNMEAAVSNVTDFLYFQAGTAKLVQERLYVNESRGMKARRLVYPIHTGSIYGWPTRLLALICSIIAASLPVTGLYIWLNRKKKKQPQAKKKRISELHKHPQSGVQYQ